MESFSKLKASDVYNATHSKKKYHRTRRAKMIEFENETIISALTINLNRYDMWDTEALQIFNTLLPFVDSKTMKLKPQPQQFLNVTKKLTNCVFCFLFLFVWLIYFGLYFFVCLFVLCF